MSLCSLLLCDLYYIQITLVIDMMYNIYLYVHRNVKHKEYAQSNFSLTYTNVNLSSKVS